LTEPVDEHKKRVESRAALSMRAAEVGAAAILLALGALVIYDSLRVGQGWAAEGPQAGFYPFYVGLALCAAALGLLLQQRFGGAKGEHFVGRAELRRALTLLWPSILFVAAIYFVGIYVSSAAFLYFFMRRHGDYRALSPLPICLGVPLAMFLMFEIWFAVALPKGPLEALLGY
jgi:putative tricarboxylic transport membrane protein